MKINKSEAVAFLVALGFSKAKEWEDEKLKERLAKVPSRVEEDEVPEGFDGIYEKLSDSPQDEPIELIEKQEKIDHESVEDNKPVKPKAKEKGIKPKVETDGEPVKQKSKKRFVENIVPKEKIPLDKHGSRQGTISAKVNAVISEEWKTEQEISKESGVSLAQTHVRLLNAHQRKIFERRRLVQYRLVS